MHFALQLWYVWTQDNFDDFSATWWSCQLSSRNGHDCVPIRISLIEGWFLVVKLRNCYFVNRNWIYSIWGMIWSRICSVYRGQYWLKVALNTKKSNQIGYVPFVVVTIIYLVRFSEQLTNETRRAPLMRGELLIPFWCLFSPTIFCRSGVAQHSVFSVVLQNNK